MAALPYTVVDSLETPGRLDLDKAHEDDAGFDLRATADFRVMAGTTLMVPTGTRIALPKGHAGLVLPRSGISNKSGLSIPNSPGLIDPGYRGEILVGLYLRLTPGDVIAIAKGAEPRAYEGSAGDRIAQLIVVEVAAIKALFFSPERFDASFGQTERGVKGFGSSGNA